MLQFKVGETVRVVNQRSKFANAVGIILDITRRFSAQVYEVKLTTDDGDGHSFFYADELAYIIPFTRGEWVRTVKSGDVGVVRVADDEAYKVDFRGVVGPIWLHRHQLIHDACKARIGDEESAPHSAAFDAIWRAVAPKEAN